MSLNFTTPQYVDTKNSGWTFTLPTHSVLDAHKAYNSTTHWAFALRTYSVFQGDNAYNTKMQKLQGVRSHYQLLVL